MHIHKINLEYSVYDWLWKIIELFIDYQLHKLVAYGSWLNQETKGDIDVKLSLYLHKCKKYCHMRYSWIFIIYLFSFLKETNKFRRQNYTKLK